MPTMEIHHGTLESFFFDEIERAKERSGHVLSPEVEAYVVSLLARFARRTAVAGRRSEPLALDYLRARGQTGAARAQALRGVGDRALYISGVAPRSLSRTPVNVRYVRGIGEAAYREVVDRAQSHGQWGGALAVLGELAEDFEDVAEVIAEIVDLEARVPTHNLLMIYERWRREGDPRDRKRLLAAGVLLDTHGTDQMQ
ncbi:hypothetical protein [Paraliomyxa miuraensis]|uniref:hypothetical protein n=1 Tax=Paraliomyxa miuraensis TaxID=376150 RepID=UPI002258FD2C|nr:hypothetical protein [Paraliomyxa miuraensis]MCX4245319.1 hypothetical protein [Paraliomyxa miuraensis]